MAKYMRIKKNLAELKDLNERPTCTYEMLKMAGKKLRIDVEPENGRFIMAGGWSWKDTWYDIVKLKKGKLKVGDAVNVIGFYNAYIVEEVLANDKYTLNSGLTYHRESLTKLKKENMLCVKMLLEE